MNLFQKHSKMKTPIKNTKVPERQRDFSLNAVGLGLLAVFFGVGMAIRLGTGAAPSLIEYVVLCTTPILAMVIMALFPRWTSAVKLLIIFIAILLAWKISEAPYAIVFAAAGALLAPSVQKMAEWERAIILRFGKFHRVKGPGLFLLMPLAERVAKVVDLRIRVTDFTAETTLTLDSVTVTVDAICFWLVWDSEKAVCEVQDYEDSVILSSKTALRSAVSKNTLSTFLERGDVIEEHIREEVDKKTTEWGITVQHIEITDVQIPEKLQDSLSHQAQMEREKKGRILLAEAEIEIARKLEEAAEIYDAHDTTLLLKSFSILNEGLKAGNSMMLVPNSIAEKLKSKDVFGLQALNEIRRNAAEKEDKNGRG
ncbi:SPFH domain-containing protein [Sediminispirochaeta bajacaliforniensis]|uniref:SPFH domain-containing protein n=1 Tax=Sediminispirochaeta bajacaliforniensis TaxID=148 RepID=UPI000372EA0F|nr:SPFH domain-containing protein [Sediminispirochaeta bajacaliforniensis]